MTQVLILRDNIKKYINTVRNGCKWHANDGRIRFSCNVKDKVKR